MTISMICNQLVETGTYICKRKLIKLKFQGLLCSFEDVSGFICAIQMKTSFCWKSSILKLLKSTHSTYWISARKILMGYDTKRIYNSHSYNLHNFHRYSKSVVWWEKSKLCNFFASKSTGNYRLCMTIHVYNIPPFNILGSVYKNAIDRNIIHYMLESS